MRVLQVNNCDLPGRMFNGYDLVFALIKKGIDASQLVIDKYSDSETVKKLKVDFAEREKIIYLEEKYCVKNVLFPYANKMLEMDEYKNADIIHFHFTYHNMFSLLDYPRIMNSNSVWTIHDLWMLTGNCTHPLDCYKWKCECGECPRFNDSYFPMAVDNTNFMWNLKKGVYKQINPHIIVSSKYMENFIKNSPLTSHFSNVHRIPFGIKINNVEKPINKHVVIGFRAENATVKGTSFLYGALAKMSEKYDEVELQCVGSGDIPEEITKKYKIKKYGWIDDRNKLMNIMLGWDIFVMPSLAESFGLMAIEAMGRKCALVCFDDTAVAEVAGAPEFAVTAKFANENDLCDKIKQLVDNVDLRLHYQNEGYKYVKEKYRFEEYVSRHISLYEEILEGKYGR